MHRYNVESRLWSGVSITKAACHVIWEQTGDVRLLTGSGETGHGPGKSGSRALLRFALPQVLLLPPREELQRRVEERWAQGSHFMPPSLLGSQLDALMVGGACPAWTP